MEILAVMMDGTVIAARPDLMVEPGHRRLLISNTAAGRALASLLTAQSAVVYRAALPDGMLELPHDYAVDRQIVALVDLLTHLRMSAPAIAQLVMKL